jgi:uncharacterized protein (TIGR02453 family)
MEFSGWPKDVIQFFVELEAHNEKAWWQENKGRYQTVVREPMELLLADVDKKLGPSKIFRPHRDVRFSKDKTPYKLNIAAMLENGPYISVSGDDVSFGRGYYMMAKDQLAKFRSAVDEDKTGKALIRIRTKLNDAGFDTTSRDSLKTAPRGYPKDHPRIDLLRQKGMIAWVDYEIGPWAHTTEVKQRLLEFHKACGPLMKWLDTNVGPSELEGGWG